ncbi:MAG: hypothetical protein AAGA34_05555 [Pseudomonadota bacterium]
MNWRAAFVGWLVFGLTNLFLVFTLFQPYADLPPPPTAPVHPLIGFTVYVTLMVALFAWTAERMASPWRAALALGGAQFLLVNVDMVLRGDRALETALASAVMMAVTWAALAFSWQLVAKR